MTIQTVGIREFRAKLHKYTKENNEPIAITSHGEPIGYFIPVGKQPSERDFEALMRASEKISSMLADLDVDIDELVEDFKKSRATDR
ncbi:MAG: type II toxin-antitoxin system prevent-host-death family antitoxin [Chloroflexota bacterium]